ncbi:MAG: molybdopterin-dependent oxidoreductase [Chloroflexi bacterium]|nr:molybdopterin-dependent oxidoreductase [Chloroflexota bacterium]MBP8058036.1 molybdopterin-dependent oxidoreductase [Chloroflexota bacterium]
MKHTDEHDPLRPHSHDPNPAPPTPDPTFILRGPAGQSIHLTPADLTSFPHCQSRPFYIVTTSHGTTGPFVFGGVTLVELLQKYVVLPEWFQVEAVSGDGFGTRIEGEELLHPHGNGPIMLSTHQDGQPLTRDKGLIRLIVPSETDDALRQVKWLAEIRVIER